MRLHLQRLRFPSQRHAHLKHSIFYTPYPILEQNKVSFADWAKGKPYYRELAPFFERLCPRTPQTGWEVQFLVDVLKTHCPNARTVLDIACGTGRHARLLTRRGYDVVGIDASPSLLAEARKRDSRTRYRQADMRSFNLGRTFDGIICLWDAYPYLSEPQDLAAFLGCCSGHLHPGGILILESRNYSRPCNTLDRRDIRIGDYDIEIYSSRRTLLCDRVHESIFTSFIHNRRRNETKTYLEQELNRIYDVETIRRALHQQGFQLIAVHGDFRLPSPFVENESFFQILIAMKEHEKAS